MNKKIFNVRLFWEAMRQQKLIGWMAFIVLILEAVLIPLQQVVEGNTHTLITEQAIAIHPLMVLLYMGVAPLMTLSAFGFLNKRSSSDFYHAIPDTRVSLFLSTFAAILAWCAFLIVSGFAAAILFRLCFGYMFMAYMDFLAIGQYMLMLIVGCFFTAALTAGAMCLTGTWFTNILVALMVLLVPRSLATIVSSSLNNMLPYVGQSGLHSLLDWSYNIPLGTISYVFSGTSAMFGSMASILYTFILGLLYAAAALLLFMHRRSETAGKSAPNRALQCAFRLVLPALISIPVTMQLFAESTCNSYYYNHIFSNFTCLVFYIIAIVAYLLYELVTTRKWRNVLHSLPGLGILLVINLLVVATSYGYYRQQSSFRPADGDVVSVEYVGMDGYWGRQQNKSDSYFQVHIRNVPFNDTTFCNELARHVTRVTEQWENSGRTEGNDTLHTFRLKDRSGRTWVRKLVLSDAERTAFANVCRDNEQIAKSFTQLPEARAASVESLSVSDALAVYNMLRSEVATLDFNEWYDYAMQGGSGFFAIRTNVHEHGKTTTLALQIDANLFPKTTQLYFERIETAHSSARAQLIQMLDTAIQNADATTGEWRHPQLTVDLALVYPDTLSDDMDSVLIPFVFSANNYASDADAAAALETLRQLRALLTECVDHTPQLSDRIVAINYASIFSDSNAGSYHSDTIQRCPIYMGMNAAQYQKLVELTQQAPETFYSDTPYEE